MEDSVIVLKETSSPRPLKPLRESFSYVIPRTKSNNGTNSNKPVPPQPPPGVVVLEEGDFETVPEAVRGQSLAGGTATIAPSASGASSASGTSEVLYFDPERDASADIRRAVEAARREGKHVLVEVGGNWCGFCKTLDKFFLAQPDVARLRQQNYVFVKVNFSEENQNATALQEFPAFRAVPHFYVLDGKGELVRSQRVALLGTNTGYSPERFREFLKAFAPGR